MANDLGMALTTLLRKAEMTGIRKSRVSRLCEELDSEVE